LRDAFYAYPRDFDAAFRAVPLIDGKELHQFEENLAVEGGFKVERSLPGNQRIFL
jgi:hypothetical protein